jgi:hypothetical protein
MLGISLTADQVRAAPPEVRHWLEQQLAGLFSLVAEEAAHGAPRHLALLGLGDAQAVLEQIEDLLPVVTVFFELGRQNAGTPGQGVRVFRLIDILRHTRLESVTQVIECLEAINDSLRRVRQDPEALICGVDRDGRCFVTEATSRAILALWQGIVASRALQTPAKPDAASTLQAAAG